MANEYKLVLNLEQWKEVYSILQFAESAGKLSCDVLEEGPLLN